MRDALRAHQLQIRDVGLLPEGEFHRRSAGSTPYDLAHDAAFPFEKILATADFASSQSPYAVMQLRAALADGDSAVRYWAVLGLAMHGAATVQANRAAFLKALDDASPDVRIAAAEALGRYGSTADVQRVLPLLGVWADWSKNDVFTVMAALNALDALGDKAAPLSAGIKVLPNEGPTPHARYKEYPPRLLEELRARRLELDPLLRR